jgi:hypothetical protein
MTDTTALDEVIKGIQNFLATRRQKREPIPGGRRLTPTEYLQIILINLQFIQEEEPVTNADWKTGFHRALVDAIVREGSPHDPARDGFYGSTLPNNWVEIGPRVAEVGIDYANTPRPIEANWMEFGGTFDENERKYGVDVELHLLDGTRVWYRYSGSISTLILAVVED